MSISLRDFQEEDFETLWRIDQMCFAPRIAYSRRELSFYIRQRGSFTLVAEEDTSIGRAAEPSKNSFNPAIFGFLVVEARNHAGHLVTIDVLPQTRRSGIGSQMLAAAEERLRAKGCQRMYLETAADNRSAIAFYKKHQYFAVRVVPRYYSNGVDALVMEKNLLSAGEAG